MQPKKKKSRVWLWILLAVVITIIVVLLVLGNALKNASKPVYTAYTVENGTVERTITGSGRLKSEDSSTLQLPGGVLVDSVAVEAGDTVKAGDVLATLDLDSLSNLAATTSSELSQLDSQISSRDDVTRVSAPVRGRVKYLPATKGEDVLSVINQYGVLALLSTDKKMQLSFTTDQTLALYSKVSVRWDGGKATGMVYEKTSDGYLVTVNYTIKCNT